MAFASSLNCSRVGEPYIEVVGVTAGTGIIDITCILCNVSYLRSRGSLLPDHRVRCGTNIGATIFATQIPEVWIARMGNSLDSKRDAAIFIRSQSLRIISRRLRHEAQEARIGTGRALRLSVPLGWHPGTYKPAGVRNWPGSSNSEVPGIEQA